MARVGGSGKPLSHLEYENCIKHTKLPSPIEDENHGVFGSRFGLVGSKYGFVLD